MDVSNARQAAAGPAEGEPLTPARAWMRALEASARASADPTRTFPLVVAELGARFGEKPALLSDRETFSFAALAGRMNRYGRWAIAAGADRGAVTCLLMPNRPEYLAVWLGIAQVGGVVALLNVNLTGAALAHCIASRPRARHVIVAGELAPAFASAVPHLAAHAEDLAARGGRSCRPAPR